VYVIETAPYLGNSIGPGGARLHSRYRK
jgi:hypothetical protein